MHEFLSISEVAAITLRSRQWVYDRIRDSTFEVGSREGPWCVTRESVVRWLDREIGAHEVRLRHYYDQLEEVLG